MDYIFSRRAFFKLLAVSAIIPLPPALPNPKQKKLGKLLLSTFNAKNIGGSYFNLLIYDLDYGDTKQIPTKSLLHSFEINPLNPNEIVSMGQWESELYIFDLKTLNIKRVIKSDAPKELFVGHGAYSPDGNLFYASVALYGKNPDHLGNGFINVYDVKSGKKLEVISSEGFEPHSILWLKDGKELLVLNPGISSDQSKGKNDKKVNKTIRPSISLLDIPSNKLLKKIDLNSQELCFGHLSANLKNDFFLIGAKRSGINRWKPKAYKFDRNLNLTPLELDGPEMDSPLLSPIIDQEGRFSAATSPSSNTVYFWNFKNEKLLKKFEIKSPTGITLTADHSHFAIAANEEIVLIDANNLEIKKTLSLGAHQPKGHIQII